MLRVFEDIAAEMAAQAELDAAAAETNKLNQNFEKIEIETNNANKQISTDQSTTIKCEENSHPKSSELDSKTNQLNTKTVINNSQTNFKTNDDQLNEKVKRVLDNEETRQSSSDISGYHSDENTDYLNNSIQSGQQNSGNFLFKPKKSLFSFSQKLLFYTQKCALKMLSTINSFLVIFS